MEFNTFKSMVDAAKTERPKLFQLGHDHIPGTEEIFELEKQYHIQLPQKYVQFLLAYGGGYFGYANIYSLDKNSSFYLLNYNKPDLKEHLYISDNGCGDNYAFHIENGICSEIIIFYDHEDGEMHDTEFCDIFEYLVEIGLNIH